MNSQSTPALSDRQSTVRLEQYDDPRYWLADLCRHGWTISWDLMNRSCPWPVIRIAVINVPGVIQERRERAITDWLDAHVNDKDYVIVYQKLSVGDNCSCLSNLPNRTKYHELAGIGGIMFRNDGDMAFFIMSLGDYFTKDQEMNERKYHGIHYAGEV